MKKHKKIVAALLAVTLAASPIIGHLVVESYAVRYDPHTMNTGLKLMWSEIPTTDGTPFGWPRKTYFEGGTGEFADMNGRYTFCVANHTGQPPKGTEAWVRQKTAEKQAAFYCSDK